MHFPLALCTNCLLVGVPVQTTRWTRSHQGFRKCRVSIIFAGANIREGKKLVKYVYNAVAGSVSAETVLKGKCLTQAKDILEYGMEQFLSVLDIWAYLITETEILIDDLSPAFTARTFNLKSEVQI